MSADSKHPGTGGVHSDRPAEEPSDLIKDVSQIIRYIEKALVDEENVEITINDRTRIYFTYFLDHLPNPVETLQIPVALLDEESGPPPEKTYPPYKACSYLHGKKYLLVAPLAPAMGNALIRVSREVEIRFFQGVKALETTVSFEGTLLVRGEPVVQLSFPKEMRMFRKRRHYRAPLSDMVELQLNVIKANKTATPVRLVDMSVGGMGFCNNSADPDEFLVGTLVKVEISSPEHEKTVVNAYVRNVGRPGQKDGCLRGDGKVGLQFDLPNETMAMRIEEFVAYLQREYLQCAQAKKNPPKAPPSEQPPPVGEKKGMKEGLTKLLGLKKNWNFS